MLAGKTYIAGSSITKKYTFSRSPSDTTTDYTNSAIQLELYDSAQDIVPDLTLSIGSGLTRETNSAAIQEGTLTITETQVNNLLGANDAAVIGFVWAITPPGHGPIRLHEGGGYDGTFTIVKESSVATPPVSTVWAGKYTNSDTIALTLGGRMMVPDYEGNEKLGWSGPLLEIELIRRVGEAVEAEMDILLTSAGLKLPIVFKSPANRDLLQLIATKAICCELFRATPVTRQRSGDIGDEDLEAIEALVQDDYCTAMQKLQERLEQGPLPGEDLIEGGDSSTSSLGHTVTGSRRGCPKTNVKAEDIQW